MSSQKLQDCLAELRAERAEIPDEIEGWNDYARLNIRPDTKTVVQERTAFLEERLAKIDGAIFALSQLDSHGYPDKPKVNVDPGEFADLQAQLNTITIAFGEVSPPTEATSATISTGPPVEQ